VLQQHERRPAERADQIPRLDRKTAASGKHQADVLPGPAEGLAVGSLLLLAGKQRGTGPGMP
jgi:hypothetical protein